jgi:hypothetical protein
MPQHEPERSADERPPAAETVAHLSETTYRQRINTLTERVLPRLMDEADTLSTVDYDRVLGHLKVVERMSLDNPFSVLKHSQSELDAYDWDRINDKHPVHGLAEQARRLVAGDVQRRILEAVANDEVDVPVRTQQSRRQR